MGAVGIGLPPAIARGLNAHEPGIEPVLHEAHQHPIFNQRRAVGGRALIIDAERAAAVRNCSVINHGNALGGDAAAHEPGKGRRALAVEIAFQAMADGFMQQDAGPARTQEHIDFAGRRRFCIQ